jgi:hypothetical protein
MLNGLGEEELQEMLHDTYGDKIRKLPKDYKQRVVFDGNWWADNLVPIHDPELQVGGWVVGRARARACGVARVNGSVRCL